MADTPLLQLGIARLARYGFAGFLAVLVGAIVDPEATRKAIDALGPVLAPLAAVGLGGAIYVGFRQVLGNLIIYPVHHFLHQTWDRLRGRTGVNATDTFAYLSALGVPQDQLRTAYVAVRSTVGNDRIRSDQDMSHSELHALWLTATVLGGGGLASGNSGFVIASAVVGVAGLLGEIQQHSVETARWKAAADAVRTELTSSGLLQMEKESAPTTQLGVGDSTT